MGAGSRVQIEGELSKQTVNDSLAKLSARLDRVEGKTEATNRTERLNIDVGNGPALFAGGFYVCRYGNDSQNSALARGAYIDSAGQWVAASANSVILAFTSSGLLVYVDSNLTPGVPFTPTLDTTIT